MKKQLIVGFLIIISIFPLKIGAAATPISKNAPKQKALLSSDISLISKDKQEFEVSPQVAKLSIIVKDLIEDLSEAGEKLAPIPVDIDGNTLNYLISIMKFIEPIQNESLETRLHKIREYATTALSKAGLVDWIKLLQAIHLLNIEKLLDPFVDSMVRYMYKRFNGNINTIVGSTVNMPVGNDLKSLLAKYWDLNYWPDVLKNIILRFGDEGIRYDFSIEERAAFNKLPAIELGALNLTSLFINDLKGLDKIPEIASVRKLLLVNNHLETIPEGIFDKLPNLKSLDLSYNRLHNLPNDIVKLNLDELNLVGNTIDPAQKKALQDKFGDNVIFDEDVFRGITKQEYKKLIRFLNP